MAGSRDSTDRTVILRRMRSADVPEAAQVFHLALEAFPAPRKDAAVADQESLVTAWLRKEPQGCFVAEVAGQILGVALALHWGSVGFVGPLAVHPSAWRRGIGSRLMERCQQTFDHWHCTHVELHTFAHSAWHAAFYEKCGFTQRGLTTVQSWEIRTAGPPPPDTTLLSSLKTERRARVVAEIRQLTHALYPGLALDREIHWRYPPHSDILLLRGAQRLEAFAICDFPEPADEATCHLKFAAVRPGAEADAHFEALLNLCQRFAAAHGCTRLSAGVNEARTDLRQHFSSLACRNEGEALCMTRENPGGFLRQGDRVLTDWP